jgi:chitin disaccharide deacetylase
VSGTNRKRLVVHADDFGFTPAVTRGILDAHAAGVVTSTSVMVGTPGWLDAATHIRSGLTLDVGVHLNLLVGHPLTTTRTLTDPRTGTFVPLTTLIMRALTGRLDPADVAAECQMQIDMLRETGARVTHIDSHRHTHLLPGIWAPVHDVARQNGIRFVRVPSEPWRTTGWMRGQLNRIAVSASAWRPGTHPAARFAGLALDGAHDFERGLLRTLDRLAPGLTELMVHPGYPDAELTAIDGYTWQRERELAALRGPAVRARLARGDIELTHFGAIFGP